ALRGVLPPAREDQAGLTRAGDSAVQSVRCRLRPRRLRMQTVKFVHWQDGDAFLGYLLEYPDYWTQGDSLEDLKEHLADLYRDLTSGELPGIRKVDELPAPTWRERRIQ